MSTRRLLSRISAPLAVATIGMFPGLGLSQYYGHSGGFQSGTYGSHGNYSGGGYHNPGAFNGGYNGAYYQRDGYYHAYPYYYSHGGFYPGYYDALYPGIGIGLIPYTSSYRYWGGGAYSDGNTNYYSPLMMGQPAYDQAQPVAPLDRRALVTIRVPTTDAQVWIEDQKTSETGTTREYRSPKLEKGHHYTYEIRAQWKQDGQVYKQSRKFPVNPGDHILVDFAKNNPREVETKPSAKLDSLNAR
jgi:uncharacterized protein (TIGR03000 family)